VDETDSMAQGCGHESPLELDSRDFSSQDPDKALTLVCSVLTQRRQAVQVRTPIAPQPWGWRLKLICAPDTSLAWTASFN
jgi:hypothetical protein